mmetsp:Transcript_23262/g.78767  ORF Transcript_23262/g.78767 Transcript_23262/m.78767 type:complete len:398 (-) Transcript_23262:145-1338(-)
MLLPELPVRPSTPPSTALPASFGRPSTVAEAGYTPGRTRLYALWQHTEFSVPDLDAGGALQQLSSRGHFVAQPPVVAAASRSFGTAHFLGPSESCGNSSGSQRCTAASFRRFPPCSDGCSTTAPSLSLCSGSLTERGSTRSSWRHAPLEGLDYVGAFKAACLRKYRTMVRAWRLLLDPKGVGRVPFTAFCQAARSMGFCDLKQLWAALDDQQFGFLTLDRWDSESFRCLIEFRQLCIREYGGLDTAFSLGMDLSGAKKATMQDLAQFCAGHSYRGSVQVLFSALDVHEQGFITADQLEFLSQWQGLRFLAPSPPRQLPRLGAGGGRARRGRHSLPPGSVHSRSSASLQAMPELAQPAAARRRRVAARRPCNSEDPFCAAALEEGPTKWVVPTGMAAS